MKKRIISLLMAVMMLVALVVPASATTDTSGTVTVYVTYGMFTEGWYWRTARLSGRHPYFHQHQRKLLYFGLHHQHQ